MRIFNLALFPLNKGNRSMDHSEVYLSVHDGRDSTPRPTFEYESYFY